MTGNVKQQVFCFFPINYFMIPSPQYPIAGRRRSILSLMQPWGVFFKIKINKHYEGSLCRSGRKNAMLPFPPPTQATFFAHASFSLKVLFKIACLINRQAKRQPFFTFSFNNLS